MRNDVLFRKILSAYRNAGIFTANFMERGWDGPEIPRDNTDSKSLVAWLEQYGSKFLSFMESEQHRRQASKSMLAISSLMEDRKPSGDETDEDKYPDKMAESGDPSLEGADVLSSEEHEFIRAITPYAEQIQQVLANMVSLPASSSVFSFGKKLYLSNTETDVTIPLDNDDLKNILDLKERVDENDVRLENEKLTAEEVEIPGEDGVEPVKAHLISYNGIPLCISGVSDEFVWSVNNVKKIFKGLSEKKI